MRGTAGDVLQSRDEGPPPRPPGRLRRLARRRDLRAVVAVAAAAGAAAVALAGGGPGLLAGHGTAAAPPAAVRAERADVPAGGPASPLLTSALLRPRDAYGDLAARQGASARDSAGFRRLHRCDPGPGDDVSATRTLAGAAGPTVTQRVVVNLDAPAAEALYAEQVRALRACPGASSTQPGPATPPAGDVRLFVALAPGASGAAVAVIRVGAVVTEVVRRPGAGGSAEAATLAALATRAVERLRSALPYDTGAAPSAAAAAVTRIPPGFRVVDEQSAAAGARAADGHRRRDRLAAWALGPCGAATNPTDALRPAMLTVTRSGPLGVQSMQLALFPDDASAARAWAGLREVVVGCALGRPPRSPSSPGSRGSAELWTARPLALGSRGLVAVGRYRLDGRPVSGNAHAAA
ncbi:MAG: hypothetical protein ABI807_07395, partial [Sporichthyaceae bacterium]